MSNIKEGQVYFNDNNIQSVVQVDINTSKYKPSESELVEFATYLGMNTNEDDELMWISRYGLTTPLPDGWKPIREIETGEVYYFNFQTGESIWDHPLDEKFKTLYKRESQKRREGKLFKTCPDDETDAFIHSPLKDEKKNEKGESESKVTPDCKPSERETKTEPSSVPITSNEFIVAPVVAALENINSNTVREKVIIPDAVVPALVSKIESPPVVLRASSNTKPLGIKTECSLEGLNVPAVVRSKSSLYLFGKVVIFVLLILLLNKI